MNQTTAGALLALMVMVGAPRVVAGQAASPPASPAPSHIDETIDAGEADDEEPARELVKWNEFDGKGFTFRFGGAFLYEHAAYSQDEASTEQFALHPEFKMRDVRVLLKGRLKFDRPTTWCAGIMFDAPNDEWVFRQTGIMVDVPEIWGQIFVGRTKEGVSLSKVMVGYHLWGGLERYTINDAALPILADGVKWIGYLPEKRLLWNFGVYGDWLSESQGFSTYEHQIGGRLVWLPLLSLDGGRLLHVGFNARHGAPEDGILKLRSRPEVFEAPFFVDTGDFAAESTTITGPEVYYRSGPVLIGSEYLMVKADAPESGNPFFHGGEAVATWIVTGETRAYNTRGGYFNAVSPSRPVFQGGPGAWEISGRYTYIDLDSGTLQGGTFWRLTPMVNWYLSDNVRLEMAYGYGSLNRFDLVGKTQFFQTRLQLVL